MQFISFQVIIKRIKAIKFLLKDKDVPKRKKALVIVGIIYLFVPVDVITPVELPIAWVDDMILWIWILWTLRDELDAYWLGDPSTDLSKKYKGKTIIKDVNFEVDEEEEGEEVHPSESEEKKE
jgi:uncharacterized membrane protein YkvA (DUF1232 family)